MNVPHLTAAVTTLANAWLNWLANGLRDPLAMFLFGLALLVLFFWYFATESEKRKRNLGTIIITLVGLLCALALAVKPLKGGVDIKGGSSFTLRVQENKDETGAPIPISSDAIGQAISTIQQRLDPTGALDLNIQRQGESRIIVQMPGITPEESAEVRVKLEKVALLELKEVHRFSDQPDASGRTLAQRVLAGDQIEPGYQAYSYKDKETGAERTILLRRRAALDGTDVEVAFPDYSRPGHINVRLNGAGADKMVALTKDMRQGQDRIAILLDGQVLSAPVVQAVPLGKQFEVSGLDGKDEARNLASALMNPLKNPMIVEEQRAISPTLGEAVVKQGILAMVVGLAVTFVFMAVYYRLAGVVALVGLLYNTLLLFGIMAMFGFTFTLPGIAGMVLSIGMAVDANVLIYERLREEIESGKSLRAALHASYDKAFSAIFDSNLTSLITAAILFWRASGTVKGFAVTLTIGLVASMLAALMLTRVLFWWGSDLKVLKKLSFLSLIPNHRNYDFLGKRRICLVISLIITVIAVGALGVKREQALSIDFTGGTLIRFQLGDAVVPTETVEKALDGVQLSSPAQIQQENSPGTGALLSVRTATEDAAKVTSILREKVPALAETVPSALISFQLGTAQVSAAEVKKVLNKAELGTAASVEEKNSPETGNVLQVRTAPQDGEVAAKLLREQLPALADKAYESTVGPVFKIVGDSDEVSASLGREFLQVSIVALVLGLIGILIYIAVRYEFSFAVGGFIALAHDILLTIGLVVLFGDKMSLIHVGAILTIAGYSINDTIIVFDRVRETLRLRGTKDIQATMNEAINTTLSRTILTSGVTLFMVIMLYVFGRGSLRDFSFMIFIGIVLGTFSSIFVASPIVLWWAKLRGTKLGHDPSEPAPVASGYKAAQ